MIRCFVNIYFQRIVSWKFNAGTPLGKSLQRTGTDISTLDTSYGTHIESLQPQHVNQKTFAQLML